MVGLVVKYWSIERTKKRQDRKNDKIKGQKRHGSGV